MLTPYRHPIAIVGLLTFCCGFVYGAEVENILVNGGFEDRETAPWSTYGAVAIKIVDRLAGADVAEDPIEGEQALNVLVNAKGANFWDSGLQHNPGNHVFEKGKKYTLAAFLKTKEGTLQINFKPELGQDPWTGYGEQQFTMTDTWQEFHSTTQEMPAAVVPASITFHIAFEVSEFWIDGVRFFEGDYVPPGDEPQAVEAQNKLTTTWGHLKAQK